MTTEKIKTKEEIIQYLREKYNASIPDKIWLKIEDHKGNPLAPERYCYKVSFVLKYIGKGQLAIWPNTVGYQERSVNK